jgi:hypothetical protein
VTDSSSCEPLSAGRTLTERGVRAISLPSGVMNVKPGPLMVFMGTGSPSSAEPLALPPQPTKATVATDATARGIRRDRRGYTREER